MSEQSDNVRPLPKRKRSSLRSRLRADFDRVTTPAATLWPRSIAGLVAGLWSCLMSLLLFVFVVVLAWVLAPLGTGEFGDVLRASASIWLLANGGALQWQGAVLSLPPLLLTAVLLLFMRRAGGWLADAIDAEDAASAKQSYGFAIAAVASVQLLVAAAVQTPTLQVSLGRSMLGSAVVSAVGFGWGLGRVLGIELPEAWYIHRVSLQRFVVVLGTAAAALVIASAVVHRQAFADVTKAVAGDFTSTLQLLFTCIVFLPTFVMWVVAVLLGPGFTFGAGTHTALTGVELGALPPIPLLALIPNNPAPSVQLLLAVPLAAALWSTRPVPREEDGRLHLRSVVELVLLGAIVGLALGMLAGGGLGPGRLTMVGPVAWQLAVTAAGWLLLACGVDELVRRIRVALRK